jgi:hypothetical protein
LFSEVTGTYDIRERPRKRGIRPNLLVECNFGRKILEVPERIRYSRNRLPELRKERARRAEFQRMGGGRSENRRCANDQ